MIRPGFICGVSLIAPLLLTACGAGASQSPATSATPLVSPTSGGAMMTQTGNSSYPRLGHAPDYSWVAGWVSFTKIQGGCVYIRTDAPPVAPGAPPTTGISGPFVGTAVQHDTSPPLRDITPVSPSRPTPDVSRGVFVPGGTGWQQDQWKDGDYIIAFGHVAGPSDGIEMCPGGAQYVIDRVEANP